MDPYKVLGVSRSATDDEIKKAYKQLAKKYHPDMHVGDPDLPKLEQKFKQIQEAYNLIMQEREGGGYGHGSSYGGYSSNAGGYDSVGVEMQAAANYINAGRWREALNVLNNMSERDSQWYYLSALCNSGLGNNIIARQHAEQALRMEPNRMEYRFLVEQLSGTTAWYSNQSGSYQQPNVGNSGCCECLAINLLCNLCCPC